MRRIGRNREVGIIGMKGWIGNARVEMSFTSFFSSICNALRWAFICGISSSEVSLLHQIVPVSPTCQAYNWLNCVEKTVVVDGKL